MPNPLVAFALVAEEFEKSGDPIRGLKPLFAPILAGKSGQTFDAAKFAEDFTRLYGLEMSGFVAEALSERLALIELLTPIASTGRSGVNKYVVAEFDWTPERIDEQQIDQTVKLFCKWARQKATTSSRSYSDSELEDAILVRLARPEFASIFTDEDGAKKTTKLKNMLGIGAIDPTASDNTYLDYLVAEFVLASNDSAPEVFKSISLIAYGSLIADAVAGLAVPSHYNQPDPALRVVLDGPLILDLLDLNTPEHHSYALGLVEILKATGMRLATFDHSVDEMRGSIRSTVLAHGRGVAFGPLAERFRTNQAYTLFASTVADTLEARIAQLEITVLRSDLYEEARFKKYFPDERVDRIRNTIGDLHENVEARIRDAKSVATVARLKGENRRASSVLEAGTIFVTRNSVLCKRVLRALAIGRSEPDPTFVIATDGQMAGVLWFLFGAKGVELSRKRLIANCSSAILPRREVISRIASLLNSLEPKLSDEFSVLMRDGRASMCPMRMTGGMVESLDAERSVEVLQAMREALSAPVLERAMEAEAKGAHYKAELERSSAAAKEAVLVLQSNVTSEEELRAQSEKDFAWQLAQLDIELAAANQLYLSAQAQLESKNLERAGLISKVEATIAEKEREARSGVLIVFSLIAAGATIASIALPDFGGVPMKVVLVLVYLLSFKMVAGVGRRVADRIVARLFMSDRRYLAGLRKTA